MQLLASLSLLAGSDVYQCHGAFVVLKTDVAALLSAVGPKKARPDERCVWLSWTRGELITQDRTLLVRFSAPSPDDLDVPDLQVSADDLKPVATKAKAKDGIVVAQRNGQVILAIVEDVADLMEGATLAVKDATVLRDLETVPSLMLTHSSLTALVPSLEPEGETAGMYSWDSRFAETLFRVAKASGKGRALSVFPPIEGGPFRVRVLSNTVDPADTWDVVAMPLS